LNAATRQPSVYKRFLLRELVGRAVRSLRLPRVTPIAGNVLFDDVRGSTSASPHVASEKTRLKMVLMKG